MASVCEMVVVEVEKVLKANRERVGVGVRDVRSWIFRGC